MRFVLLSQYYPPEMGAPQVRLPALLRELGRRGHRLEVVTAVPNHPAGRVWPGWRGRLHVLERREGLKVHRCWLLAGSGAGAGRMASYASFGLSCLAGLARCARPDYLLLEQPPLPLAPAALAAARLWRARLVPLVADLWPDAALALGLLRPGPLATGLRCLERALLARSFAAAAVTEGIAAALRSKGMAPERILPLPNGVDPKLWRPLPPEPGPPGDGDGRPLLLYTGTMGYAHGLEVVLEAARLLAGEARFLLVGAGSERPRLEALARELDLGNLRFRDPVPPGRAARLYASALAGLCPVRPGPLAAMTRPAKLPAIMACAKPVLYSGEGEGARLVRRAGAGVVCPPGDAGALAAAVRALIAAPERARAMGEAGRRFVLAELAWPAVAGRWLAGLEALS